MKWIEPRRYTVLPGDVTLNSQDFPLRPWAERVELNINRREIATRVNASLFRRSAIIILLRSTVKTINQ
jgi:hypothetical protein